MKNKIQYLKNFRLVFVLFIFTYMIFYISSLNEWHFIDNINLIFHEAGHAIFIFFGQLIQILGGTITQVLIPIICSIYFYKKREFFPFSIILFWVGQNLLNVSVYAGDAIKMELPLLGGDSVNNHDWNWILSDLGILKYTDYVSSFFYISGIIVIIFALIIGLKYSFMKTDDIVT